MENCDENLGAFGAIFFNFRKSRKFRTFWIRTHVGRKETSLGFELMHQGVIRRLIWKLVFFFFSGNTFVRVLYLEVVKIC